MEDASVQEQLKRISDHLAMLEKKIDQLVANSERQPASNEGRTSFAGGFRSQRPSSGPPGGGFRGARPQGRFDRDRTQGRYERPNGGGPGGYQKFSGGKPAGKPGGYQKQGYQKPYQKFSSNNSQGRRPS